MYLDPRFVPINMVSYPMDFRPFTIVSGVFGGSRYVIVYERPGFSLRGIQSTVGGLFKPWFGRTYTRLVGGFKLCEKYESHLGLLFPIYGNIKHVPNHQPDIFVTIYNGCVLYKRGLGILM